MNAVRRNRRALRCWLAGISLTGILHACVPSAELTAPAGQQTDFPQVVLEPVAYGFSRPVFVTAPPEDVQHVYVIEQWSGKILKVNLATGGKQLFYTVTGLSTGYSYGLVGMAFHPDFAGNGKLYLSLTTGGNPPISVIREYTLNDAGMPASPRDLLVFLQPNQEHNNGWIGFGPRDGLLYITTGDGGPGFGGILEGGNPSQRLDTVFGKVLRIDVDHLDPGLPYRIPDSSNGETPNPFIGRNGEPYRDSFGGVARPEIWAFGLRSPWRNSFDRQTGDMYIGDTGDSDWEWLNFLPANSRGGQNFRWCVQAGSHSVFGVNTEAPNQDELMAHCVAETSAGPFVPPLYEYPHDGESKAVIGGYVYRGCAIPDLRGTYFFADNSDSTIFSLHRDINSGGVTVVDRTEQMLPDLSRPPHASRLNGPSSFGEDAAGELYVISYDDGVVYKIVNATPKLVALRRDRAVSGNDSTDMAGFQMLVSCMSGPCTTQICAQPSASMPCCSSEDSKLDHDVDLLDVAVFQNHFVGP